jgi:hypothetical protein
MSSAFTQTFFGFVRGWAVRKDADAKRVVSYGSLKRPTKQAMQEFIAVSRSRGEIDATWHEELLDTIDRLWSRYQESSQLVDTRDPREWEQIGCGGVRRRNHLGRDESDYEVRQLRVEGLIK